MVPLSRPVSPSEQCIPVAYSNWLLTPQFLGRFTHSERLVLPPGLGRERPILAIDRIPGTAGCQGGQL